MIFGNGHTIMMFAEEECSGRQCQGSGVYCFVSFGSRTLGIDGHIPLDHATLPDRMTTSFLFRIYVKMKSTSCPSSGEVYMPSYVRFFPSVARYCLSGVEQSETLPLDRQPDRQKPRLGRDRWHVILTLGVNLLSHEGNGQTGHRMLK